MSKTAAKIISEYVGTNGSITTAKANELCCHLYYYNHEKYVSETLKRLCNAGRLVRKERGLYVPVESLNNPIETPTLF